MNKLIPLAAVLAAACAFTAIEVASAHPAHSAAAKRATLVLHTGKLGKYIVDGKGRTLYLFMNDKTRRSTCYHACAHNWPPYRTSGKPKLGAGLSAAKAGTVRRSDGTVQVTYGGHPLYRFIHDTRAGQTNGQGLNAFGANWYVVQASGKKIDDD
jgi:predicted lipoprotein with Yx(FWY)xxD motif